MQGYRIYEVVLQETPHTALCSSLIIVGTLLLKVSQVVSKVVSYDP